MTPRQIDDARRAAAASSRGRPASRDRRPALPKLIETAEAYQVDPTREGYPDLIALPDEPYWVKTKLTSRTAWVEPDANLPGTHRPEGVVALAGVGLPAGRNLKANLIDATPTILALLGQSIPSHIEGTPIAGAPEHAEATCSFTPFRHDTAEDPIEGPHRRPFEYTSEEQEIIEQRLADLGYLE